MSARRAERKASPLFELARVLERLDDIARIVEKPNHSVM
jgi:hypothetical protein